VTMASISVKPPTGRRGRGREEGGWVLYIM
jgi:hypothetical protein